MKNLKLLPFTAILLSLFLTGLFMNPVFGQEEKEAKVEKEINVKVVTAKGSDHKMRDTVIVFSGDDDKQLQYVIEEFLGDEEGVKQIKVTVNGDKINIEETGDEDVNIWIDEDNKEKIIIKSVNGDENEMRYVIKCSDSTMHMSHGDVKMIKKCDKHMMFISEDGEVTEIEMDIEGEGKECKKVIVYTDGDGGEDIKVITRGDDVEMDEFEWHSKDGNVMTKKVIIMSANDDVTKLIKAWGGDIYDENLKIEKFGITPDPEKNTLDLLFACEESGILTLKLFDDDGKAIIKEKVKEFTGKYKKTINLEEYDSDVLYLNIAINNKSNSRKIIFK